MLPRWACLGARLAEHTDGALMTATISYNARTHTTFHVNSSAYADAGLLVGRNGEDLHANARRLFYFRKRLGLRQPKLRSDIYPLMMLRAPQYYENGCVWG